MNKEKTLWTLFSLQILLTASSIAGIFKDDTFTMMVTYLPLLLLVLHACWVLTVKRGLAFIFLASFIGWAAEAFSLHYGTLFGGDYTYPAQSSLLGVPIAIITYWAVFIYTGYWLVTSFLLWLSRTKPDHKHNSLLPLGLLVLADGLAVVAIDLFMDPISVRAGSWTWLHGGPYFGVPVGNFVGWFMVTVLATGLFRLFEYYKPQKAPILHKSVFLLPVLGYLLVGVNFLLSAVSYRMFVLAVIGTLLVIVPAAVNILLYWRALRRKLL